MTNKQFIFSISVGGLLISLGGLIALQASIGIALAVLGLAISALALATRNTNHKELIPAPLRQPNQQTPVLLKPVLFKEAS